MADTVDTMVSGFTVISFFKASQNAYFLAMGTAVSPLWTGMWATSWSIIGFIQLKYLMAAYLSQVFLIDEIELLKNLKQIRIRTMVYNSINIFTLARFNLVDKNTVQKEYVFDIKDCDVSEKHSDDDNYMMRLQIGEKKFFLHRARTVLHNQDLVRAIFTKKVHKIE